MRPRAALNLALLAAVAGLAALAWYEAFERPEPAIRRISALEPAAIERVRLVLARREPIVLRRGVAGWRLESPLTLPANALRVNALLGAVSARSHAGFRAAGNDLSRYGLDPPRASLFVDDRELRFGDTEPLNGWRYVLFEDEVHLVTDAYFQYLAISAPNFAHPAPLGPDADPVEIRLGDGVARRDEGAWTFSPGAGETTKARAATLARAWREASATSVRRYDANLPWNGKVEVRLAGAAEPLRFAIARNEFEVMLARPPIGIQYHLPKRHGDGLLSLPAP